MKILCTGGAGFIGSHLVDRLLKDGDEVLVVDNLNTGKAENLPVHQNLEVVNASTLDNIGYLFEGVDIVFHLAALTRPQQSILKPIETNQANVEGTLKVLLHCRDKKVKRLVFASSSSLYGTQKVYPVQESATPSPESPYGLQKLIGEQYCQLFGRMYGLEVNCIRPFNIYGTRQNPLGGYAAAVPSFIRHLSNNEPGEITGDGEQSRDFTYIDDLVGLMVLAATSKVSGESFNAGAGRNVTVNYLYQTIAKIMKKDIKPIYIPAVPEPRMTLANTWKAKTLLGWTPKVMIEEGLRRTIKGILNG